MSEPFGRILRFDGERWAPLGAPLPELRHLPAAPGRPFAPWVIPRALAVQAGDIVAIHEQAHQLLAALGPDDPAVSQVIRQSQVLMGDDELRQWLATIELWLGRRLDGERPWPKPPSTLSP